MHHPPRDPRFGLVRLSSVDNLNFRLLKRLTEFGKDKDQNTINGDEEVNEVLDNTLRVTLEVSFS